ncbi:hypothetical protein [Mesonia aquimarina]|uniref:hypothetical protein n=1 Tax=Mesonia aquimarina TaxID=1504967 RepID=UPI000EF5B687|nr:hypothetical protein [Mesonia aquimarina]
MSRILYKERIISYIISIPVGMLILFVSIAIVNLLLNPAANQLAVLTLLISLVFLCLLFYHLYQLRIEVSENELCLRFGAGRIRKAYTIDEIKTDSFQKETIPWYYGMGWKLGYGGKTFFCAQSGLGLSFRLKNQPEKIIIATTQYQELQKSLMQAQQRLDQKKL